MSITDNILKEFAQITNGAEKTESKEPTVYGTIKISGEKKYVQLDGTETLTPVSLAMDAQDGDRVIVVIRNHVATITGNITSPASARTATSYMNLTEDGLVIGVLDSDGKPIGTSSLIAPGAYYIVDSEGVILASFTKDSITLDNGSAFFSSELVKLGKLGTSIINFCNGFGFLKVEDNTMRLQSEQPVGMRNEKTISNNRRRAEVVCTNDNGVPKAIIQSYTQAQYSESSVVAYNGRVDINVQNEIGSEGPDPTMYQAYINGNPIVTANTNFIIGRVKAKGSVAANDAVKIRVPVGVPYGYTLCGVREVTTNHDHVCHLTEFVTNVSEVGATIYNTSTTVQAMEVTIEWFALRASDVADQGDIIYNW